MPPSQLKKLRASLRENGITGPSQKKKKGAKAQAAGVNKQQNAKRIAVLQDIRETFNPFEYKKVARPDKFAVTTYATLKDNGPKQKVARPGVTKSLGEDARRRTLLPEIQRRNKVGGIVDRRIGENDPTMTPEDRMLQRFTRESQRRKRNDIFNLEDADDEDQLTHLGQSILGERLLSAHDDFDEPGLAASDEESEHEDRRRKRQKLSPSTVQLLEERDGETSEIKKSKKEVMEEVIAKSKFYKYERQQAKEDDDDVREALDKDLPNLLATLRGGTNQSHPASLLAEPNGYAIHPDRAAIVDHDPKLDVDKEYDVRLRQIAMDKKAQPTERTKTEEEIAEAKARQLKELEEQRVRRMNGIEVADEDAESLDSAMRDEDEVEDQAAEFGFKHSAPPRVLDVEDEDEFLIDSDLVASGSEIDSDFEDLSDADVEKAHEADDEDFLRDILPISGAGNHSAFEQIEVEEKVTSLPYTFLCPQTHSQLLEIFEKIPILDYPTAIQRIRTLYNPKLEPKNKEMLGNFSKALVDHLAYIATLKPPLSIVENIIRHIHSLSRVYADLIATSMRAQLLKMHQNDSLAPGDLLVLTAISSIYPTSDHFHQVVTPAIVIMARWLGLMTPKSDSDHLTGAYLVGLCVKFQQRSKRYIPETLRFTVAALKSKPPNELVQIHTNNILSLSQLWATKTSVIEMFSPEVLNVLESLHQNQAVKLLRIVLSQSQLKRRPLELHHHRPLAIKTSIPKFEDSFNPDKHYDPDRERAEASKLRAEYKREHKGALRELKKDAMFIAREKLKEKKEKNRAHEAKQRRLIAEIQGEEGHEKNAYEREKRARKGRR